MSYDVNKRVLANLNISLLKPNPYNTFEHNDLSDLEGSLLSCGLLTPLSVIGPNEQNQYQILTGERRYYAMVHINEYQQNTFVDIPCYIVGDNNMSQVEQKLIIESSNLETRDFNKDEHRFKIMKLLKEMVDEGKIEYQNIVNEAGKYMSVSDRYRRMYLQIFENGNLSLRTLVEGKKITVTEASRVSKLNEETQEKIIDEINNGIKPKVAIAKISPQKRGRKKKEENEENKVNNMPKNSKKSKNDEMTQEQKMNEQLIDALVKGEAIDESLLNQAFDSYSSNIDLTCDTTGQIGRLKKPIENAHCDDEEQSAVNFVMKWCNRMMRKYDYTDEEYEAIDAIKELISHIHANEN
jgi:ParB family chromosome partitioning protein